MTTVSSLEMAIYGAGDTLDEAVADFHEALVEYRDLLAREERLSPGLRDLLARLAVLT